MRVNIEQTRNDKLSVGIDSVGRRARDAGSNRPDTPIGNCASVRVKSGRRINARPPLRMRSYICPLLRQLWKSSKRRTPLRPVQVLRKRTLFDS